jgi:hypothetical protein
MPFVESEARAIIDRAERVLCVLGETLVHPRWERIITGAPIGRTSPKQLTPRQRMLVWKSLQQYRNANPRDAAYMLTAMDEVLTPATTGGIRADLLMPAWMRPTVDEQMLARFERSWLFESPDKALDEKTMSELQSRGYDAVILLYPDGNGMGWRPLERRLSRVGAPTVVLNGRRRLFLLDAATRRSLLMRRCVERSWVLESAAIVAVVPVGLLLAGYDAIASFAGRRSTALRSTR